MHTLSKSDLIELHSYARPPEVIKLLMEAICIIFGLHQVNFLFIFTIFLFNFFLKNWINSKKLLGDFGNFVNELISFDRNKIKCIKFISKS